MWWLMIKIMRNSGVTMLELAVVLAIISIIAFIAYPSFVENRIEAARSDAQIAVVNLESVIERYLTENNKANFDSSDLALDRFASFDATSVTPALSVQELYRLTIVPDSTGYSIIATATVDGALDDCDNPDNVDVKQCNDLVCREIYIYHGEHRSRDSDGVEADEDQTICW